MLQRKSVEPGTLSLLTELVAIPELKGAALVGGTALALRFDHRKSIDLDLFFTQKPDFKKILDTLGQIYGVELHTDSKATPIGIFCFIRDIKVDLVYFPFELLSPLEFIEQIPCYSNKDIAAMKIKAILGRAKKKDFWDLYELLHHFSVENLIDWYFDKFPNHEIPITIPTVLTYFTDAEESEDPVSLKGQTWEAVKLFIRKKVSEYLR